MPLVENKATVVRVYPDVEAGSATVQGELTGFRDGEQLGTAAQYPGSQSRRPISDWDAVRSNAEASLNFRLPDAWLHGTVDLIATLDVDVAACGVDAGKPQKEMTIAFSPRRKLKIVYIPLLVETGGQSYDISVGDILEIKQAYRGALPAGGNRVSHNASRETLLPGYAFPQV